MHTRTCVYIFENIYIFISLVSSVVSRSVFQPVKSGWMSTFFFFFLLIYLSLLPFFASFVVGFRTQDARSFRFRILPGFAIIYLIIILFFLSL